MVNNKEKKQRIKCVVWDLDNTIWDGVLLEKSGVTLKEGISDIIKTIDNRGILQSIASKNEHQAAMLKLEEFGLKEYFIYPQINWNSKSSSIKEIAKLINIGLDSIAFVDDQEFEREEVKYSIHEVLCIDALDIHNLVNRPELIPEFITEDSKLRRSMYLNDIKRKEIEENFEGTKEEFLSTLNMIFTIAPVTDNDLQRAEELTIRTHQMNTTGYTYSYDKLEALSRSKKHKLFITGLEDRFGRYGKIGLSLVEIDGDVWTIKLLLMSCRVISRGVGTVLLNYIMQLAKDNNVRLFAEFVPNDRNRMMYITYKFAGFKEIRQVGDMIILENDLSNIQSFPDYIDVKVL